MRWNDNRRQPMSGKHDKQKTRGAANTHNEKKDIIDPDTYFDGLCVRESWVSALLQYCTLCQFIRVTARWFSVGILNTEKKTFLLWGGSIFIHIDARRYSSRGKRFAQRLISRTFQFLPDEIYFLLFLLFFLSRTRPLSLVQPKRPKVCIVLYGWCV